VALLGGLLVVGVTVGWLGRRGPRRQLQLGAELEVKAAFQGQCGSIEQGVDYVLDEADNKKFGMSMDHVPSPQMCCAMCHGVSGCKSWTWVKDALPDGCPSQCWLKGGEGTGKPKVGVVSGVPPPKPVLPPVPSGVGGPGGSLWCFSLMVPTGYEKGMLQWQHARKASIFACDGYGVYSNKKLTVAPGVTTSVVDSDLKCQYGGDSGTALNAWIFIAVWEKVIQDKFYQKYDWVVKVDPDCVFFPDRLGKLLAGVEKKGYINNCKYGMHGPIEVFSSDAIDILGKDYEASWDGKAPKMCVKKQHFGQWGEDMFLDQCLGKILEVKPRPLEPRLMCEAHCDCPAWYWCQNGTDRVSYHPFKTQEAYEVCMANALGGKPGPPTKPPAETLALAAGGASDATEEEEPEEEPKEEPKEEPEEEGAAGEEEEEEAPDASVDSAAGATAGGGKGDCMDAGPHKGKKCFKEVQWAKEHGIFEHPEWYESKDGKTKLSSGSSNADFQQFLFEQQKVGCPKPCGKGSAARTSKGGREVEDGAEAKADADAAPAAKYPPGPRAQTFYMYRAQSKASYPLENINTADLAGVMWYLHNEVVRNTPRKYHIDRIRRFKVTVKNTWEFWNAHKRQFGAFVAYDAARCSTPICKDIYHHYGFIVGCQVCDIKVAAYLAKDQTNWACQKGADNCRAPLWYSLPGPCPAMGLSNDQIAANKVGLDVMSSKSPDCLKRMPGGHCDKATGAPDCTYSYEEAGEIMLDELAGIGDYDEFWNHSYTKCAAGVAEGRLPKSTKCVHQKEYDTELDKGIGCSFWDGIHDSAKGTERMNAVRRLFKKHYPNMPLSLPEPPCEFDMYYEGEFKWPVNHTGASPSDWWDQRM